MTSKCTAGVAVLIAIAASPAFGATKTTSNSRVVTDVSDTCDSIGFAPKFPDVSYHPERKSCEVHKRTYRARRTTFARGSKSGQFAVAQAQGQIGIPVKVWVEAVASPRQVANVVWGSDCERAYDDGSGSMHNRTRGGHLDVTSSQKRVLRLALVNPDDCAFTAAAGIQHGTVRIRLIARIRGKLISDKIIRRHAP